MSDRWMSLWWFVWALASYVSCWAVMEGSPGTHFDAIAILFCPAGLFPGCAVHGVRGVMEGVQDGLRGYGPDPGRTEVSLEVLETLRWGFFGVGFAGFLVFLIGAMVTFGRTSHSVILDFSHGAATACTIAFYCVAAGEFWGGFLRRRLEVSFLR